MAGQGRPHQRAWGRLETSGILSREVPRFPLIQEFHSSPLLASPHNLLDSLGALGFSMLRGQETHRWNGAATWYGTSGQTSLFWNFHEFPVILLASVGTSCGKIERNGSGFTGAFRFRWIHGGFASSQRSWPRNFVDWLVESLISQALQWPGLQSSEREKWVAGKLIYAGWIDLAVVVVVDRRTLPETKIAPENGPSQKETSIPTIHFQVQRTLVSGRVDSLTEFFVKFWFARYLKMHHFTQELFSIHCSCTYKTPPIFPAPGILSFFHRRFQPSPENQKAAGPAMSRGSFRKIGTIPWHGNVHMTFQSPKKIAGNCACFKPWVHGGNPWTRKLLFIRLKLGVATKLLYETCRSLQIS